jgi:CubicO group peptidase (beta-lactamase class C family)
VGQALHAEPIAGVTVAVIDGAGVVLAKGYGLAAPDRAVDDTTLFRVGSISKTFTWIALMQLAERGAIGLDDPINQHLPASLQVPDDGFTAPIRVRDLMTHSAGFEDSVLGHLFVQRVENLQPLAEYLATHRVHRVRAPGVRAVYSNYGAALAGALVATVSGLAWEDYAEQRILRPLGMGTATYREPYPPEAARARGLPEPMPVELAARLTLGWSPEAGHPRPQAPEFLTHVAPAASLSASARDMAAYMRALLDPARMEETGVLPATTALRMREPLFANVVGFGPIRHGFLDYRLPGQPLAYGHDGGTLFQHAQVVVAPALGIGVFLAINSAGGRALHDGLCTLIVREFFAHGGATEARYGPTAAADAQAIAGTYLSLRRPYFRTERAFSGAVSTVQVSATAEGDLLYVPAFRGESQRRYVPVGDGRFRSIDDQSEIWFALREGRMLAFDSLGVLPAERLALFERPIVWMGPIAFAHIVVLAGLFGMARRRLRRRPVEGATIRGTPVVDGVILTWAAALALLWAGVVPLLARNAIVVGYPGPVLPLACWALAIAALATLAAVVALPTLARRSPEPGRRWLWPAGTLVLLALAAAALGRAGLLGFSGW